MRIILTGIALASITAANSHAHEAEAPAGYQLAWADEFDRDGAPDPALWRYDTHANGTGWYNNELQYYAADRLENARVEDGHLIIEARRESLDAPDSGGQTFTSARMISRQALTHGVYEIRARLPCARGTWPAIWMLPEARGAWPAGGEIDIMEHVGHRPGVVHGTVHTGAYNHVAGTEKGGEVAVPDACQDFHRYQLNWTAQATVFSIDDQPFYRFDNDGRGDAATWPFDKAFALILNVAVGGDWGGAEGVDEAVFPQRMEVDYVRVYQPTAD